MKFVLIIAAVFSVLAITDIFVADLTKHATIKGMAASVLRDAPWMEFALAGLSMGGYVAQEIMRQAPQRVTKLALLDTRSCPELPEETERREQFMKLAQTERGFTPVTNRMLPLMLHESRVKDAPLVKVIREMAERTGVEGYVRQQKASLLGRISVRCCRRSSARRWYCAAGRIGSRRSRTAKR